MPACTAKCRISLLRIFKPVVLWEPLSSKSSLCTSLCLCGISSELWLSWSICRMLWYVCTYTITEPFYFHYPTVFYVLYCRSDWLLSREYIEWVISNQSGKGLKRSTSTKTDRRIVRMALNNRRVTSDEINESLQASGIRVTSRTVRNRLIAGGLRARIPRKKPYLSKFTGMHSASFKMVTWRPNGLLVVLHGCPDIWFWYQ